MFGFPFVAAGRNGRNPESSSTSSSSSSINHEVFLSFRGADTRKGFTDHLYSKLVDAEIQVFRDDEKLSAGEPIKSQLIEAIKGSKISIAVLSKDYASSKSCLMEIVQMWECRESNGQTILPIFYDISPGDVKNQAGDFENSFKKHVKDGVNADTIQKWKEVFREIGKLSGFDRENINGGHEAQLVKNVVRRVKQVLKKDDRVVTDKLVRIDHHVQVVMKKLGVAYSDGQAIRACGEDVRVVGICGMRGVGKTTLAKVVFNKMSMFFDECSFVEDINSQGVVSSQETLIADLQGEARQPLGSSDRGVKIISSQYTRRKVLIVLDDVRNDKQIEGLAGTVRWFGPGSRIIVTTHIKNVLKSFDFGEEDKDRAAEEYEIEPMGDPDALQLFRKHAFQGDAPPEYEYDSLSIDIANALGGLPMAIVLRAKYLNRRKDIKIWRNTLDSLNNHPYERAVSDALEASYNYLDDNTKEIFLDIACFFSGKDERIPSYMWGACGYRPPNGIELLRDLHLLEVGENIELRMHALTRDFGRAMVKRKESSERCRFWDHSDARSILDICTHPERGKGIGLSVKGIGLTVEEGRTGCFTCEEFCKMLTLTYLRLDRAQIQGNTENLPPSLRWLAWRECHLIPELCDMHLKELVILELSWSPVTRVSRFWEQIMEAQKLKVLNLQGCVLLRPSLNFPAPINLEMLIMEDCTLLSEIRPFIKNLKKLSSLNLRNCSLVTKLPQELYCMESLRELVIDGTGIEEIYCEGGFWKNLETLSARNCKHLQRISTIGSLRNLSSLTLDGADIGALPDTFEFTQTLKRLSLRNCCKLVELPPSIGRLKVLEVMDLSYTGINKMPSSVKELTELKTLNIAGTHLKEIPNDVVKLAKLEEMDFSFCISLEGKVRCDISGLSSLRILRLNSSNVAGLPSSICYLSRLHTLDIGDCNQLQALPRLPDSLLSLRWGSKSMTVPDLSYLTNLRELLLTDGEQPKAGWFMTFLNLMTSNIGWITRLPSLETLQLSLSKVTNLPQNFSALIQLRELTLSHMKELDLTQLPSTSSLSTLRLKRCNIRKPKFSSLKYLSELELEECDLAEIDGLEDLKRLEVLKVLQCNRITDLNGLKDLSRLRKVKGTFSARPSLPDFSNTVELDIYPPDSSPSVA